jgi:hypothetical protein
MGGEGWKSEKKMERRTKLINKNGRMEKCRKKRIGAYIVCRELVSRKVT